jgi:hypothetical protein
METQPQGGTDLLQAWLWVTFGHYFSHLFVIFVGIVSLVFLSLAFFYRFRVFVKCR